MQRSGTAGRDLTCCGVEAPSRPASRCCSGRFAGVTRRGMTTGEISHVSASRSRFHGRSRRHHEDADSFADAITELCRVGYPQSSLEFRQELISEQFVRGQSDPELKKYLWVVIRTQKDRKQTLIEVSTDFASLSPSVNIHRPVEQTFAVEEDNDSEEMFAMMDHSQWTGQGVSESAIPPSLAQPSLGEWDMRLLVGRTNRRDLHERRLSLDRDIINLFSRGATSPRSSVSTAVRCDIYKLHAQSQI